MDYKKHLQRLAGIKEDSSFDPNSQMQLITKCVREIIEILKSTNTQYKLKKEVDGIRISFAKTSSFTHIFQLITEYENNGMEYIDETEDNGAAQDNSYDIFFPAETNLDEMMRMQRKAGIKNVYK